MSTLVFPGQGAQKLGMGKDLFDKYPEKVAEANEILGYSVEKLCLEDPDKQLNLTQFTQPALYTVSGLMYLDRMEKGEPKPDYLAGHSLGEYNALFAAGVFDFATGLKLVKKRGELMAAAGAGGMAAVMNISRDDIERILAENGLGALDIANFNAPSQIVISGPKDEIERATGPFEDAGARYVIIKVNSAFHSRYMKPSRDEFAAFLTHFDFDPLQIPVIANVSARPYHHDEVKTLLANQISSSVNWVDTIRFLMGKGEEKFVECGPGRVLTGLNRKIAREAEPLIVPDTPPPAPARKAPSPAPAPVVNRQTPTQPTAPAPHVAPTHLGSTAFKNIHGLKHAYLAGAIERGVSSVETVVTLGKAKLMGFYGSGGLEVNQVEAALDQIQAQLNQGEPYGMSLTHSLNRPELEAQLVALYLRKQVRTVEASNYLQMTPSLVAYRLKGLTRDDTGVVRAPNRIIARVTRPEVATLFMSPPPQKIVTRLRETGAISAQEASLAGEIPMAHDVVAMADSGGPTDQAVAYALIPAMLRLRDELNGRFNYTEHLRLGAGGGIGTPEAAAAAFVLGADFVMTGSINQATLEAATSSVVKDMLVRLNVQDTTYAPAGEMFEMGARIQVLKRGMFFPARANKLYSLYQQFSSLDDIDEKNRKQVQEKYFKRSFDEVWRLQSERLRPEERSKAEQNPKYKMLLVFKWYFDYTWRLALEGSSESKVDYQVYCGPAMGAFNQWVKGTPWEGNWHTRQVHVIADKLMAETVALISSRLAALHSPN